MTPERATARFEALGTTALVQVLEPAALTVARRLLERELEAIDRAASRFREDSELSRANAQAGRFVRISPLLHEAIAVALAAAQRTGGAVDPTLGNAIRLAGYERDYSELEPAPSVALDACPPGPRSAGDGEEGRSIAQPAGVNTGRGSSGELAAGALRAHVDAGWGAVRLLEDPPQVLIPAGMALDLGATAKALAADRAAREIARETGGAVLVSLGGDIAVAGGCPPEGWLIHVTDDHRSGIDAPGQTVSIRSGALATSSITTRRWLHGGRVMHHILQPATGLPAVGLWRTASVAAPTCVEANTASTAAIVLGERAGPWLKQQGLPARLVARDGRVLALGGWPA